MMIRVLDCKNVQQRLLSNVLEALAMFLRYDKNGGLTEDQSVKVFFESNGGLDALNELSNHTNFGIYNMVHALNDEFFQGNEEVDFFFSQDYQSNTNNIYDDTNQPRSDEEDQDNFII